MIKRQISIIIPTYNETGNIRPMLERIKNSLSSTIEYEIIYIDDHSSDSTIREIDIYSEGHPVSVYLKKGKKGKAFSILEGFRYAKYENIAMIDADLQYPPEAIPEMLTRLNKDVGVVVADRVEKNISFPRKLMHWGFKTFFGKILHGLDCDVQSGLKVFRAEILRRVILDPSPWTFDLDFLLQAMNAGYKIESVKVDFTPRKAGVSKVRSLEAAWEIGLAAVKSKFKPTGIIPLQPLVGIKGGRSNTYSHGFHFKGKEFIHYSNTDPYESAFFSMTKKQKIYLLLIVLLIASALMANWHFTVVSLIGILTVVYFFDLIYYMFLIGRSFIKIPEIRVNEQMLAKLNNEVLPFYTILCPLYKESEVLPQFIAAIKELDYPKDKLQVMLLLEKDDRETIQKARKLKLPEYFEIVVVPDTQPKTKPKACNYGLLRAKGEYAVIYDAEDIPEPKQLKKVVYAFKKAGKNVECIQAKLNFYNPQQNLLTRLFTAEYSLWFELILTGLQSFNAPIPLGGTSNHFRTQSLRHFGWDAFNVTEDCDLGIRLSKKGYQTAIVDSTTLEEANSEISNWFNQRTRWVKGYIQTYLVHMRETGEFIKKGKYDFSVFQLIVGGKVLLMLVNPLMWIISITYFVSRSTYGEFIESLFPPVIFYMGIFSMVVGNFLYLYYYMVGVAKRQQYDLVKYAYLVPIYWLIMSLAAWTAVYRLIRQPHYWSKTKHGLHLKYKKPVDLPLDLERGTVGSADVAYETVSS